MPKAVATSGDVKPETGSKHPVGAKDGSWEKGDVDETTYDVLKVGGKNVVHEAKCTFTYKNGMTTTSPSTKFPDTDETVTLTATTKVLQHGGAYVLVNTDSAEGKLGGNKLTVKTQNKLASD